MEDVCQWSTTGGAARPPCTRGGDSRRPVQLQTVCARRQPLELEGRALDRHAHVGRAAESIGQSAREADGDRGRVDGCVSPGTITADWEQVEAL
jgi:hypothetical protein